VPVRRLRRKINPDFFKAYCAVKRLPSVATLGQHMQPDATDVFFGLKLLGAVHLVALNF
jgi:hypothetical protein